MSKKQAKSSKKAKKSGFRAIIGSWFYRIYFPLLILWAVALGFGLNYLSGMMAEYEASRPVHFADEAFEIFSERSWSEIYALDESARALSGGETAEQYAAYMQELTAGKTFTRKNLLSLSEDEQKYSILADGQKFAEMTISHSGEATPKHGYPLWELKGVKTFAMAAREYSITAPADSTVSVNGRALTEADIVRRDIPTEAAGNLPDGVAAPTMVEYAVELSFGAPEDIAVTDKNGRPQQAVQADERSWTVPLAYDDETIKAQVEEGVVKWGRRIAAYTTGDYSKSDLSGACINPSPARTYIRNMENQWAASHDGYDFENIQTYDYYVYSDKCFSCRVSFDYIVHYKAEDKSYPTLYTLYFYKSGDSFKLYSFTMN